MQVVYERPQRPPVNKFELKRFENRVRKDYNYELKCLVIDSLVENWDQNIRSRQGVMKARSSARFLRKSKS
jgi:hypothetical protein